MATRILAIQNLAKAFPSNVEKIYKLIDELKFIRSLLEEID